jgi:hypothetical protein
VTTTFVDAIGATRAWINSRTTTLVGPGKPLQKGVHLRELDGAADTCYAYLTMLPGTGLGGGAESGWMTARVSAQVYGPSLEAVTTASVALADEIATGLCGQWAEVTVGGNPVRIWVGDDITGPSDLPDGNLPRHIVDFTLIMQPALA